MNLAIKRGRRDVKPVNKQEDGCCNWSLIQGAVLNLVIMTGRRDENLVNKTGRRVFKAGQS